MNIEFLEEYMNDSESISIVFWAKVDEKTIRCTVSRYALQDYKPETRDLPSMQLFECYKGVFQEIARKKIMSFKSNEKSVSITKDDLNLIDQ